MAPPYRCAGAVAVLPLGRDGQDSKLFKVLVTALLGWLGAPSGLLVQLDHPGPGCEGTWPCPDPCAKKLFRTSNSINTTTGLKDVV